MKIELNFVWTFSGNYSQCWQTASLQHASRPHTALPPSFVPHPRGAVHGENTCLLIYNAALAILTLEGLEPSGHFPGPSGAAA